MKKVLCTSLIAASFVFAATAYSADGVYVSADVGVAILGDADATDPAFPKLSASMEFDTGAAVVAAVGYKMQNFRFEGEIGYQKNDFDQEQFAGYTFDLSGDQTSLTFLANVYYDFPNTTKFTPFITAGIGFAQVDINDLTTPNSSQPPFDDDDTVLAGQVGAGVSYAINEMLDAELKYRYFMADDLEFSDNNTLDGPSSHNIYLGLRYTF